MLIVAEMTGGAAVLAPAMVAVGVSCLIAHRSGRTMFPSQVPARGAATAATALEAVPPDDGAPGAVLPATPVERGGRPR